MILTTSSYQYKKWLPGSDWVCNSIITENTCVLSSYISCPNRESGAVIFLDEFWRRGETKQKREYFVTYCIFGKKFAVFEKKGKNSPEFFLFLGSRTANPLFSADLCRPCIQQWPSASMLWMLKKYFTDQTNK